MIFSQNSRRPKVRLQPAPASSSPANLFQDVSAFSLQPPPPLPPAACLLRGKGVEGEGGQWLELAKLMMRNSVYRIFSARYRESTVASARLSAVVTTAVYSSKFTGHHCMYCTVQYSKLRLRNRVHIDVYDGFDQY